MAGEVRMDSSKSRGYLLGYSQKQKPYLRLHKNMAFRTGSKDLFCVATKLQSRIAPYVPSTFALPVFFDFSTKGHNTKCTVPFLNFIKMENCSSTRT
jgi:hypothetical protein